MKKQKLLHGVGILDADYDTRIMTYITDENGKRKRVSLWRCPIYTLWSNMLQRCYYDKIKRKAKSYLGCTVVDEWHRFSNFRKWVLTQDWEGNELDKDLLVRGNKVYGPDTCCFLSKKVNAFLRINSKGGLPGASWDKGRNKWFSCCNGLDNKTIPLGRYTTEQEAHMKWVHCKMELAVQLSAEIKDEKIKKALIEHYKSYMQ